MVSDISVHTAAILNAFEGMRNEPLVKMLIQAIELAYKHTPDRQDYIKLGDESSEISELLDKAAELVAYS